MDMNPQMRRWQMRADLRHRLGNLLGQHSPVGIAQDEPRSACGKGHLERRKRIRRIRPIAIEEVFGVIKDRSPRFRFQLLDQPIVRIVYLKRIIFFSS